MPLDSGSLSATATWEQSVSTTGTGDVSQSDTNVSTVTFDESTINRVHYVNVSLAASASATYDLRSLTSLLGESDAWTKVQGIKLQVDTGGGDVKLEPGASNPATWFFSGTTPAITVKAGGFVALGDGSSYTISATVKTLKLTNTSGSLTATGTLVLFGGV